MANNNDNTRLPGNVFSFTIDDILNQGDNQDGNGNPNNPFATISDTIRSAFNGTNQDGNNNTNFGIGIANLISNMVNNLGVPIDEHVNRKATKEAIESLKPLKLNEIPNKEENSQCPICYEPYAEYHKEEEEEEKEEEGKEEEEQDHNSDNSHIVENHGNKITPFDGYHLQDPSIIFPSIETATYSTTYNLYSEPEFLPMDEKKQDTQESHYAVQLPQCNHIFGLSCIKEWLNSHVSCPLCRREILPEQTEVTHSTRSDNNNGQQQQQQQQRTYVYDTAITETYVPIDWTSPPSMGCYPLDPPLSMPVPGLGMSSGRRTGRNP